MSEEGPEVSHEAAEWGFRMGFVAIFIFQHPIGHTCTALRQARCALVYFATGQIQAAANAIDEMPQCNCAGTPAPTINHE